MKPTQALTPEQELEIFKNEPEPQVCMLLAQKVRELRNATGESQTAFAQRAGISLRTYKRFELEGQASLENFIQILRALDRTRYLPSLFVQFNKMIRQPSIDERIGKLLTRDPKEILQRAHNFHSPLGDIEFHHVTGPRSAEDYYFTRRESSSQMPKYSSSCLKCGSNEWSGNRCVVCGTIADE